MKKEDSLGGWMGRGRAFQAKGETGPELKMVGSPVETADSGDPWRGQEGVCQEHQGKTRREERLPHGHGHRGPSPAKGSQVLRKNLQTDVHGDAPLQAKCLRASDSQCSLSRRF